MTRVALTVLAALTLLPGCSSTPNTSPSSAASPGNSIPQGGPQEGVGDALGQALFGEAIYLAKHPGDDNLQYASEPLNNYASVQQND